MDVAPTAGELLDMYCASVANGDSMQVKVVGRVGGGRACGRCRSGARAQIRSARAVAPPQEGRPERTVPTSLFARDGINLW